VERGSGGLLRPTEERREREIRWGPGRGTQRGEGVGCEGSRQRPIVSGDV
jgi:hypothetical protein